MAGVGQSTVSRLEEGDARIGLTFVAAILGALGLDLAVRSFPGPGVRLRDSGQLSTTAIRQAAHPNWRISFEVPTGSEQGHAADLVLI